MLELFTKTDLLKRMNVKSGSMDYVQRIYKREIDSVQEYYHNAGMNVKSNHILVVLLESLDLPIDADDLTFLEHVDNRAKYVSRTLGIVDSSNRGESVKGVFYNKYDTNIIIHIEQDYMLDDVEFTWKTLSPVKVLSHTYSDMGLLLPNMDYDRSEDAYSVFSVDIKMLALQYKYWYYSNRVLDLSNLTTSRFIHAYVLPNMVPSHADYSVFNRLVELYNGVSPDTPPDRHPFPVTDYSSKLDKELKTVIKLIKDKRIRYEEALTKIPAVYTNNMLEAMMIGDPILTFQNQWAIVLSRLDVMMGLVTICGNKSIKTNKDLLNRLKVRLQMMSRDKSYTNILGDDIADGIEFKLDYLETL